MMFLSKRRHHHVFQDECSVRRFRSTGVVFRQRQLQSIEVISHSSIFFRGYRTTPLLQSIVIYSAGKTSRVEPHFY